MMHPGDYVTKQEIARRRPVDGHVIPPAQPWIDHAAQVICGHDVVQALDEARHADFEMFVRDVLRTELK